MKNTKTTSTEAQYAIEIHRAAYFRDLSLATDCPETRQRCRKHMRDWAKIARITRFLIDHP